MAARGRTYTASEAAEILSQWFEDDKEDYGSESDSSSESEISEREEEVTNNEETAFEVTGDDCHTSNVDLAPPVAEEQSNVQSIDPKDPVPTKRRCVSVNEDTWTVLDMHEVDVAVHKFPFLPAKEPGILSPNINVESTPLDCFFQIFTVDIQKHLVKLINDYAAPIVKMNTPARRRSVYSNWKPVTRYELLKYLAIGIAMGLDKRPSVKDYWSTSDLFKTDWYSSTMSRTRFEVIHHTMLHCGEIDESRSKNKIEPFVNKLVDKFQEVFYPYQELSLDEMVVKWKGRWRYKQYNPSKPSKYHIKTFGLCDSATGYCYNLLTYFGSETSYAKFEKDVGQSEKIFEYLLRPLGSGHHIFADRYYTTHKLIEYLLSKEMFYTGTLMSNRKNFPAEIKNINMKHLDTKFYRSNTGILLCLWKDKKAKKPVITVSTKFEKEIVDVTTKRGKTTSKPSIIHHYNQSMNGCDRLDQNVSYYNNLDRKTMKWWKRIFAWIIEVSQINAYILFVLSRSQNSNKVTLKHFKESLVENLCDTAYGIRPKDHSSPRKGRPLKKPLLERYTEKKHLVSYVDTDRNCVVCSTPNNRKRTKFVCSGCSDRPYLHPKECFEKYHTKN